jgi:hypothetical protein
VNKKWLPYILIAVLGIILLIARTNSCGHDQGKTVNRNRGFDRRVSYLEYSHHADCRMDCRHISKPEVEDIMHNGSINYRKSDISNARCPRYALEGTTKDDQRVRIIFAQCDNKTVVVTVIDLGEEWECHCPGTDDDKKAN